MTHPAARWSVAAALVLAPAFGLVAAVASPGLTTSAEAELGSIAANPAQFDVYALALLFSSYLMVPAVFALTGLIGRRRPRLVFAAGVLTQLGLLVAIGDAAVESMYAAMGRTGDRATMVALSNRYDAATSWVYSIGGLSLILGSALLGVALWRTRSLPRWAAVGFPVSIVLNIAGFAAASQPMLTLSYVVLLAALAPAAMEVARPDQRASGHSAARGPADEFVA
jgi:hypothetical protein